MGKIAPTLRSVVVFPSFPEHHHSKGVEFAVFQERRSNGIHFPIGDVGELAFGVGNHGRTTLVDRILIEKPILGFAAFELGQHGVRVGGLLGDPGGGREIPARHGGGAVNRGLVFFFEVCAGLEDGRQNRFEGV